MFSYFYDSLFHCLYPPFVSHSLSLSLFLHLTLSLPFPPSVSVEYDNWCCLTDYNFLNPNPIFSRQTFNFLLTVLYTISGDFCIFLFSPVLILDTDLDIFIFLDRKQIRIRSGDPLPHSVFVKSFSKCRSGERIRIRSVRLGKSL